MFEYNSSQIEHQVYPIEYKHKYGSLGEGGPRRNDGGRGPQEQGLVSYNISHRLSDKPARVLVYENVSVVSQPIDAVNNYRVPGKRGKVQGFSVSSRRRLIRFFSMMRQPFPDILPVFLTLTYPGKAIFTNENHKWKRDLDTFFKRLRRKFPECVVVWRMEIKERLSGQLKGVEVPHFHIVLWTPHTHNILVAQGFRQWLSQSWYEVVGSGDKDHLAAGTNMRQVNSFKHLMYYVSKYVAKHDATEVHTGRVWGKLGDFDITPYKMHYISSRMFSSLRQEMVKYFKGKGWANMAYWLRFTSGLTIYGAGKAQLNDELPLLAKMVIA